MLIAIKFKPNLTRQLTDHPLAHNNASVEFVGLWHLLPYVLPERKTPSLAGAVHRSSGEESNQGGISRPDPIPQHHGHPQNRTSDPCPRQ